MGRKICKCPVESADRGTGRAHDDDVVFHQKLLLSQTLGHSLFGTAASSEGQAGLSTRPATQLLATIGAFSTFSQEMPKLIWPCRVPQNGGPAKRKLAMLKAWAG